MERDERVEQLFRHTQGLMRAWRIYFNKVLGPENISPGQMILVFLLASEGPMNGRSIGEALRLSPSATAQLLAGVDKHGYVVKETSRDDKRVGYFRLTDSGMHKWKELDEKSKLFFTDIASALEDDEIDNMVLAEQKIVDQVQKYLRKH